MADHFKFDVFLSYNSQDKLAVISVGERLRGLGLTVWLDVWELRPGHPWQEALEAIIENTRAAAVLVGADGLGPWESQEMRACLGQFVQCQLPVIPVLLPGCPQRPGLPLFLQAFTWVDLRDNPEEGFQRLLWGITGAKPTAADGPPPTAESPYRGLLPFEARHRDLFYGREKESADLLEKVQAQPFAALLGSSGSGKSSLLGAGLLPRLPAAEWLVLSLRPRNDLFDSLTAALLPYLYPDLVEQAAQRKPLSEKLAEPDFDLAHLLQGLVKDSPKRRVLLAVDQFEEVFTLSSDRPRQRRAVELLLSAIRGGEAVTLLLVLRADFFGRCLDIEPLKRTLDRWPTFNLGAMGQDALRAAIVRPAELNSLRLEQGLADAILAELGDEPGQLALLQTALDELWRRSDRRLLTHQGYRAVGGVAQALARKADEFLNGYDEAGRERLHRIFVQLVRPGEGEEDTRQIATESQVGAENWELVAQLASARLVVTGRVEAESPSPRGGGVGERVELESTTTVELAHEALIRHWQALRGWIAEDRAFRLWQNKLRDSRAEWASHGFDEGYLLRGAKLLEAEERLAEKTGWLAEDEKAFIAASAALRQREADEKERQRRERERLQKRVLHTIAAALVVALGLSLVVVRQWQIASFNEVVANKNLSSVLAEKMHSYHASKRFSESAILGIKALELDKNNYEAKTLLYLSVAENRFKKISINTYGRDFIAVSDDKKHTVVLDQGSTQELRLVDTSLHSQIALASHSEIDQDEKELRFAFFTGDSKKVIFGMKKLYAYDIASGHITLNSLQGCTDDAYTWFYEYTGYHRIDNDRFALNCGNMLYIFDAHAPTIKKSFSIPKMSDYSWFFPHEIRNYDVSTDGKIIAYVISGQSEDYTGESDNTGIVYIADIDTGAGIGFILSGQVTDIKFHSNNKLLIAKHGGRLEMWDITSPENLSQENKVANTKSDLLPVYRFEKYSVLMSMADARLYEASSGGYVLGPNMYRSNGTGLRPMLLAQLGDSYAYYLGGVLTIFDLEQVEDRFEIKVKSSMPILAEGENSHISIYFSEKNRLIIKNNDMVKIQNNELISETRFIDIDMEEKKWIIDIESLIEQSAQKRQYEIFKYLGIEKWAIGCNEKNLFVTAEVADTRFSTAEFVAKFDIENPSDAMIYYFPDGRSRSENRYENCHKINEIFISGDEMCVHCNGIKGIKSVETVCEKSGYFECDGGVDFNVQSINKQSWANDLTKAVDGSESLSTRDHRFIVFRQARRLKEWRNTEVIDGDTSKLGITLENLLRLKLDQQLTPQLLDAQK